jgi:tRNA-modifying protein YgfZ
MTAALRSETRCILRVSGPDAERYLSGQVTQDVRRLADVSRSACVTDAKGKLQFYVQITAAPDGSLWVDGPMECREDLMARLDRYLIADDAEIQDVSDAWKLIAMSAAPAAMPEGAFSRSSGRFFKDGHDLWLPADVAEPDGLDFLTDEEAEALRIRQGLPAWGKEITPGLLPPEAGLDRSCISYAKGCYIGQEVLSRIKSVGKVNRRCVKLSLSHAEVPGTALLLEGKEVGEITSVSPMVEADGSYAALGFIQKSAYDAAELGTAQGAVTVLGTV